MDVEAEEIREGDVVAVASTCRLYECFQTVTAQKPAIREVGTDRWTVVGRYGETLTASGFAVEVTR